MHPNNTAINSRSTELLTITEACAFLKIKRRTIDDWRAAKALPCITRGRWIRFRRADLEAFLDAHTVEPRTVKIRRVVKLKTHRLEGGPL